MVGLLLFLLKFLKIKDFVMHWKKAGNMDCRKIKVLNDWLIVKELHLLNATPDIFLDFAEIFTFFTLNSEVIQMSCSLVAPGVSVKRDLLCVGADMLVYVHGAIPE